MSLLNNKEHDSMRGDILSISARAKKAKLEFKDTIDGSVGAFYSEDKKLILYSGVNKYLKDNASKELAYPPCTGGDKYKESILKYLLQEKYKYFNDKYSIGFSSTLGGTGACYFAFKLFSNPQDSILVPFPGWPNYDLLISTAGSKVIKYNLIDEHGKFDYLNLENKLSDLAKIQKDIILVINDPAENPTGYSMSKEDLNNLKNVLAKTNAHVIVLFDIAYINYGPNDPLYIFEYADTLSENVTSLFAFSLSKTLSVYGLRGGALFGFMKKDECDSFTKGANKLARGIYSCPTSVSIGVANNIFSNKDNTEKFNSELENNLRLLRKRDSLLINGLKEVGFKIIQTTSSFYVTFYANNAYELAEKLESKHVFLVPLSNNLIRIAVSGLNIEEISKLPSIIKETYNEQW